MKLSHLGFNLITLRLTIPLNKWKLTIYFNVLYVPTYKRTFLLKVVVVPWFHLWHIQHNTRGLKFNFASDLFEIRVG